MDFHEVVKPALALRRETCPHCGKATNLGVHAVRNRVSGSDEGLVLVCSECGGYSSDYVLGERIARAMQFVIVLALTWGLVLGVAELIRGGGLALTDWPPLEVALPMGGLLVLGALATTWSIRGLFHVFRAPRLVPLSQAFRILMK